MKPWEFCEGIAAGGDAISKGLEIRLLGSLSVVRDAQAVLLPPSKKSRALLGYLVATSRAQLREHLCDLLWEGPDDPRGELRWSLSKLRALLGQEKDAPLAADRQSIEFRPRGVEIDLTYVRTSLATDGKEVPLETLKAVAERFRGEFLEGLDLPDCYRFHEWCVAEREAVRKLRVGVLSALVERLSAQPEGALPYARARVSVDPLVEAWHTAVVKLLGKLGRPREAIEQYDSCRRILASTLGVRPSAEIEGARIALGQSGRAAQLSTPERVVSEVAAPVPKLIGRSDACAVLSQFVKDVLAQRSRSVLLIEGEPGIGKSRMLEELSSRVQQANGLVLKGRAFEAEMVRPYGAWIDALRSVSLGHFPEALRAEVAPLLPELGTPASVAERAQLFEAVSQLLAKLATLCPVAVILDDLHWFDEASVALLHFVARALDGTRLALATGARPAELEENPHALKLVRALARDARLRQLTLSALSPPEAAMLARTVEPSIDAEKVAAESEGNPLFAIEIARAVQNRSGRSPTLEGLIQERLGKLHGLARDLLPWAAALGRNFNLELLGRASSTSTAELLGAIEELERNAVIRVGASSGEAGYDFAHDLVRRSAYNQISEPRRKLIHLQIARTLNTSADPDGALAGEVAHHAALGGDHDLAARACTRAAERCLRIFAIAEAGELAARGLRHAEHLAKAAKLKIVFPLMTAQLVARSRPLADLALEASRHLHDAETRGAETDLLAGMNLLALIHHDRGDLEGARDSSIRIAEASHGGDPSATATYLASAARCLIHLERDVGRAEKLLEEAKRVGGKAGETNGEIAFAWGFLLHHRGDLEGAHRSLERALPYVRSGGDHWRECQCLGRLTMIELERGNAAAAVRWCKEMEPVAQKLGEGAEGPFGAALFAIARRMAREPNSASELDAAFERLREKDAQASLAYSLALTAELELTDGNLSLAKARAEEGLGAARLVGRVGQELLAQSVLARVACAAGEHAAACARLESLAPILAAPDDAGARALGAVVKAATEIGFNLPLLIHVAAEVPIVVE